MLCPCCCAMYNRYLALNKDMSKYSCCQGFICPTCMNAVPLQESCPWLCLCLEALICESCALSATRIYVQVEREIVTDPCDNRIIRFNNCMQILSCICNILAIFIDGLDQLAAIIDLIADIVYVRWNRQRECVSLCLRVCLDRSTTQPSPLSLPLCAHITL